MDCIAAARPHGQRGTCHRAVLWTALAFCLAAPLPASAQKTDTVEATNGDRLTCEIKSLDRARLKVETDSLGTLSIEWDDVRAVRSAATFDVELKNGFHYFGVLGTRTPGELDVVTSGGTVTFPFDEVIRLTRFGENALSQLEGKVDAGFSFTQANVQTQWTANASFGYRTRRYHWTASLSSLLSDRDDADRQSRNTLTLQSERILRPRLSAAGFAQFQENEELALNLRVVVGGGLIWTTHQSNRSLLYFLGGAAYTTEDFDGDGDGTTGEILGGVGWEFFTFRGKELNIDTSALSFYAPGDGGRVRLELSAQLRSDIVGDLYWSLNADESFNGDPPPDQKQSDFVFSATLGWSF
jgi:hypothetical protein